MTERLFVALQYLLPKRTLSRLAGWAARRHSPWFKNTLIRAFTGIFNVDTSEMDRADPCDYPSFNAFFTRNLAPGARPLEPDPAGIACPADGTVQHSGRIAGGRLIQVKGVHYALHDLLGIDASEAARFDGGRFLTIYLAPHNYHRVHAPSAGSVARMHFIPGDMFSVNAATARHIPGLFARNERVAFECVGGPADYWLVMVGALNVASIATAWTGTLHADHQPRRTVYAPAARPELAKGDYCGHFNMGSTVIVAYPPNGPRWQPELAPGDTLRARAEIGRL